MVLRLTRNLLDRLKRFIIDRILGIHDTPHRIALGVAIGFFITWTPTIGFQMALIVVFSSLLRANKVVGVPIAWLTNPATLWLYIPNYWVGAKLLGQRYDVSVLMRHLQKAFSLTCPMLDRVKELGAALGAVFWPLWVGSIIVGLALGAVMYVATRYAVVRYRRLLHAHAARPAAAPSPGAAAGSLTTGQDAGQGAADSATGPAGRQSK